MSEEMTFELEMEADPLTAEAESEFMSKHIEGYRNTLSEFRKLDDIRQKFFDMPRASVAAYMLGSYDEAKLLAVEMASVPEIYLGTWNDGNLKYYSSWVLGMLEFDAGNIEESKTLLLQAGACKGSPQLNSFGPNMRLAKRLLDEGEKAVVSEFLDLIEGFWKCGENWLKIWRGIIESNRTPNCTMHLF